jgi:hypothetical protein
MQAIAATGVLQQPFYGDAARSNATVADAVPGTPGTGVDVLIDNATNSTLIPARRYMPGRDVITHILCNWGVNDMAALPSEATWKANYLSILDYLHTRFPQANIYIMRPWRRGFDADAATLNSWIADIVVARSSFVVEGPDEAVWLENGDNGVLETDAGGVHYSALGNALAIEAWKVALGFP